MFDTQNNTHNSMKFNSVRGTLVKSHPLSRFIRFHMNSPAAKNMFGFNATYSDIPITVLQVMLCGEQELLVEYIIMEDYERESNDTKM